MKRSDCCGFAFAVVLLVLIVPGQIAAQAVDPRTIERMDTHAAKVGATLRQQGHAGTAVHVLTQTYAPQPRAKLDEIADTLMNIAMTLPGDDVTANQIRSRASTALLLAGVESSDDLGPGNAGRRRVRYAGAAERLMTIAEHAKDPGIRTGALRSLPDVMERQQLLPFLRRVATSKNSAAFDAISMLNRHMGPEGVDLLRDAYLKGLIVEPSVQEFMTRVAAHRRWIAPARPRRGGEPRD